ncbi:MAG: DUF2939 domain-containing protein [Moraxella sp.]|nr:DUF2939 domain-containing protein [Moraxella sp.]
MKRIFLGFFVILLLLFAMIGVSPYARLYQAKTAYEKGDFEPLLNMIDYPKVQADLANTLNERLDETLSNKKELVFVQSIAPDMVDHIHSKITKQITHASKRAITADNLRQLLKGQISEDSRALAFLWAVASDYVDYEALLSDAASGDKAVIMAGQEAVIAKKVAQRFGKPIPSKPVFEYCGYDCFYVAGAISGQPVGVYLYRDGLFGWKIHRVILP